MQGAIAFLHLELLQLPAITQGRVARAKCLVNIIAQASTRPESGAPSFSSPLRSEKARMQSLRRRSMRQTEESAEPRKPFNRSCLPGTAGILRVRQT